MSQRPSGTHLRAFSAESQKVMNELLRPTLRGRRHKKITWLLIHRKQSNEKPDLCSCIKCSTESAICLCVVLIAVTYSV